MKIKRATKKDSEKVFQILQATNRWLISQGMNHWRGFYKKEKVYQNIKNNYVFLVYENKVPVGTFTISTNEPAIYKEKITKFNKKIIGKSIFPSALAVLPSKQKRGYGKKAIEFIEKWGKEKGYKNIIFDAMAYYKKLNQLYKKLGFKIIGKIKGKKATGNIYKKKLNL